jgi:DUF2993 family protein
VARGTHRWGRILLVLALVAVVLLVAADRIGLIVAEREVATQTQAQLTSEDISTDGSPSVSIAGVPFLTQVVAGHYGKITITVPDPTSNGIRLDSLNVIATSVDAPTSALMSGGGQITAGHVVGTAQINWKSFEELADLSGLQKFGIDPSALRISGAGDGKVSISAPVTMLGESFTALATGTISVTNNLLHVRITNVSSADSTLPALVQDQLQQLQSQLTFDTRIPALPYHLVLNGVTTNADGLTLTASATNVVLGS